MRHWLRDARGRGRAVVARCPAACFGSGPRGVVRRDRRGPVPGLGPVAVSDSTRISVAAAPAVAVAPCLASRVPAGPCAGSRARPARRVKSGSMRNSTTSESEVMPGQKTSTTTQITRRFSYTTVLATSGRRPEPSACTPHQRPTPLGPARARPLWWHQRRRARFAARAGTSRTTSLDATALQPPAETVCAAVDSADLTDRMDQARITPIGPR